LFYKEIVGGGPEIQIQNWEIGSLFLRSAGSRGSIERGNRRLKFARCAKPLTEAAQGSRKLGAQMVDLSLITTNSASFDVIQGQIA